jgi:hypothetical protein
MLAFIPWLRLRAPVVEGRFHLFPQDVGDVPPAGVASIVPPETMAKVLGQYRGSSNVPLRVVSVLQYDGRPLGTDFDEADRDAIFRFGQHLAVSGMSDRRFIGGFLDDYTASGHYQVVIQAFAVPHNGSISLSHRRKGGHSNVMMGQSDVHFVRPAHLVSQGEPNLNLRLLTALHSVQSLPKGVHEHVDASVTQFLLANSDSPDVALDAESIATYAALERVCNSSQRLDDIQAKLPAILSQVEASPWTARLRREFELPSSNERPVLHAWLKHIYRLRGNVAHGKPTHWQPNDWAQQEHLVAGAFVYSLVLKCLLAQYQLYALNEEDVAWVLGLEKLLNDRPFFEVSPEQVAPAEQEGPGEAALDVLALRDAARLRMTRWQRQFESINEALLGLALSGTIREVIDRLEVDPAGDVSAPDAN